MTLSKKRSYLKKKPFRRTALKRPKVKSKPKVNLWAEFGLKKPVYTRYSGYAGILWWLMSQYVRKSEWLEYGGECIDGCGNVITAWQDADCGHLKSASKLATRFNRKNLGLQRKWCNSPYGGAGNSVGFAKTVDERYGPGTALELEKLSQIASRPFTKEWYREQIAVYLTKLETVDKQFQEN